MDRLCGKLAFERKWTSRVMDYMMMMN